jgi:hypothetical protein
MQYLIYAFVRMAWPVRFTVHSAWSIRSLLYLTTDGCHFFSAYLSLYEVQAKIFQTGVV